MAGAVIGALRVELGLDSAKFQSGLAKSQSGLQKFTAVAKKYAAALSAGALAATITKMTKSGLAFVDSQAKMARSIDGTIDGLRALQQAGGDAGVNAADVGSAMQKLGRKLADAAQDGGPAADALARVGLSAKTLMGMDADARLAAIADKAKELGWSAQQTAGFLGELGIRNASMALLVAQGGDAIRNARTEIEAMGLSISAVDAAKVESANDAFSRMGFVSEAVSNRLAIAFAPALQAISVAFVSLMQEGGALRVVIETLGANIGTIASVAASFATFMAVRWVTGFVMAAGATTGLTGGLALLRGAIMRTGFGALIIAAGYLVEKFLTLVGKAGGFGKALGLLKNVAVEVFQRIGTAFAIVPAAFDAGSAKMKAFFIGGLAAMAQAFVDFTADVTDGLNAIFNTNLQPLGAGMVTELNRVTAAADAAAGAATGVLSGLVGAAGAPLQSLQALRDVMGTAADEADSLTDSNVDLSNSLDDLGGDGGGKGGSAKTAAASLNTFQQAIKGAKDEIARLKVETASLNGAGSSGLTGDAAVSYAQKQAELLSAAQEAGTTVTPQLRTEIDGLAAAYVNAAAAAENAASGITTVEENAKAGRTTLADMFAEIGTGAMKPMEALRQLLAQMIKVSLQKAALSAMSGGGGLFGAIGSALTLPGNANGTPNWSGGLTRINERGQELVNLPNGSQIIPATRLGGMGGGKLDLFLHVPEGVTLQDVRQEAANVSVQVVQKNNQSLIEKQRRP